MRLTRHQWEVLRRGHVRGLSSHAIAEETGLHRQRVLRPLMLVRNRMLHGVPLAFSGIVEVDETDVGGAWRNKRERHRAQGTKWGRGTAKPPVCGILCRGGQVWAQVVPDVEAQTLLPRIRHRVRRGSVICSDT